MILSICGVRRAVLEESVLREANGLDTPPPMTAAVPTSATMARLVERVGPLRVVVELREGGPHGSMAFVSAPFKLQDAVPFFFNQGDEYDMPPGAYFPLKREEAAGPQPPVPRDGAFHCAVSVLDPLRSMETVLVAGMVSRATGSETAAGYEDGLLLEKATHPIRPGMEPEHFGVWVACRWPPYRDHDQQQGGEGNSEEAVASAGEQASAEGWEDVVAVPVGFGIGITSTGTDDFVEAGMTLMDKYVLLDHLILRLDWRHQAWKMADGVRPA